MKRFKSFIACLDFKFPEGQLFQIVIDKVINSGAIAIFYKQNPSGTCDTFFVTLKIKLLGNKKITL